MAVFNHWNLFREGVYSRSFGKQNVVKYFIFVPLV